MKICMIVQNSGTRDGRVMREAHTLQAWGHSVTVVGIAEPGATEQQEVLADGVAVIRVAVTRSRAGRLLLALPNLLIFGLICVAAGYAAFQVGRRLPLFMLAVVLLSAAVLSLLWRVTRSSRQADARRQEALRRHIISGVKETVVTKNFPAIRSRIPEWMPERLLEICAEPLGWIGTGARFSLYRDRSRKLAAAAISLRPDIVHCHDCIALPAGWMVKKTLRIPLVYDAHEIYEAVAARRLGATDYFARIHKRYLPRIDAMIAVNDSAANYYRHAYPEAPPAVVIRNATEFSPAEKYDGRLHQVTGLPLTGKILLYQGGFTKHRGLPELVASAAQLPEPWSLVMMGSGPLLSELKERAKGRDGSLERVRFLAPVPATELLSWTQGASAGIIPYEDVVLNHWIATPNKLWEYPTAGVPVIVQPFPEMRRIVEEYACGWILPEPFGATAIAALVASLTDSMIEDARRGCRRFIEQDSWSRVYRVRLLQLYAELAARTHEQTKTALGRQSAVA